MLRIRDLLWLSKSSLHFLWGKLCYLRCPHWSMWYLQGNEDGGGPNKYQNLPLHRRPSISWRRMHMRTRIF
ncbi:unnamed protein product [Blepharisma stoltei]|uniref:Uncharacterized protein n=1 Tax=Blepharisma stoltei TaxID=1481888 RepID=A0AAU9JDE5_9CILI|nr:unnamed protein product [Blepharisma stoltei]